MQAMIRSRRLWSVRRCSLQTAPLHSVQTLLFPEQRSILREYAVRYIELFSVYYCDSKSLLRLKGNADTIPNNCKITVPLQPVEGIQGIQAYKDLAHEVASFSTAISHRIKGFVIKC